MIDYIITYCSFLTQFENELGETAFGSSGITENLDFHYDSESTAKIRVSSADHSVEYYCLLS